MFSVHVHNNCCNSVRGGTHLHLFYSILNVFMASSITAAYTSNWGGWGGRAQRYWILCTCQWHAAPHYPYMGHMWERWGLTPLDCGKSPPLEFYNSPTASTSYHLSSQPLLTVQARSFSINAKAWLSGNQFKPRRMSTRWLAASDK